jgi:hypothetical protein
MVRPALRCRRPCGGDTAERELAAQARAGATCDQAGPGTLVVWDSVGLVLRRIKRDKPSISRDCARYRNRNSLFLGRNQL